MSGGGPAMPRGVPASLRGIFLIAALAALAVLAASAASAGGAPAADSSPALPVLLERPADGSTATLQAGPAALHIAFFATWCSPCVDEFRAMAALESRWAARGYRLVLVAVPSRQSRERLATFVTESRPPGEVLFDAKGDAQRAFAVDHLPTHLVLDRNGTVVFRSGGVAEGVGPAVERLLARRAGEQDPRR